MNRLHISKFAVVIATVAVTLWAAPLAHADDGCPWRLVPAGGSLWHQAPWWPYLVGALCVLAGLILGIIFWRRGKKDDDHVDEPSS